MKTTNTTRPGHPPSRNTPVRVSKPKAKAKAKAKIIPDNLHPAEAAGTAVHQTIENGVSTVKDMALTAGGYVFGFVKGLVKGPVKGLVKGH